MRERYIDIVKGFSILCITMLHYVHNVFPNEVNVFIGSFMITAFYVTSGWVSAMHQSNCSLKELIKKRWKQLGIPYLWWTLIIIAFDFVLLLLDYYDINFIAKEIYKTITLRGIGTLWFLPALFGGEVLWQWIKSYNKVWMILCFLLFVLCYQYYYNHIFTGKTEVIYRIVNAPFRTISNILGAWTGIAFGYYSYRLFKNKLLKYKRTSMTFLGLMLCIFAYITANSLPKFLDPIWILLAPLFGPLGLLMLAKSVQDMKIMNFFNYWGLNSLNLMVTHYSIVLVLFTIMVEKIIGIPFDGFITLLCFIFSLPIQYLLVSIINRYAKFTLGK